MPKALDSILLGHHGVIAAGQDIPSTYLDDVGTEHKTDFADLKARGLLVPKAKAEPEPEPAAKSAPAKSSK